MPNDEFEVLRDNGRGYYDVVLKVPARGLNPLHAAKTLGNLKPDEIVLVRYVAGGGITAFRNDITPTLKQINL